MCTHCCTVTAYVTHMCPVTASCGSFCKALFCEILQTSKVLSEEVFCGVWFKNKEKAKGWGNGMGSFLGLLEGIPCHSYCVQMEATKKRDGLAGCGQQW